MTYEGYTKAGTDEAIEQATEPLAGAIGANAAALAALEARVAALEAGTPTDPDPDPPDPDPEPDVIWSTDFEDVTYSGRKLRSPDFDRLDDVLPWYHDQMVYYQPSDSSPQPPLQLVADPVNPNNRVLKLENTRAGGGLARSQWSLWQNDGWNDTGGQNLYEGHTFEYDMFIPSDVADAYSTGQRPEWWMIWQSHGWADEPANHGVYIEKRSGSDVWYFRMIQEVPEGSLTWENTRGHYFTNAAPDPNLRVEFDKWFHVEITYVYGQNGLFEMKVDDRLIGRFEGRTQHGNKVFNITMFKHYHDDSFISDVGSMRIYFDNLAILTLTQ